MTIRDWLTIIQAIIVAALCYVTSEQRRQLSRLNKGAMETLLSAQVMTINDRDYAIVSVTARNGGGWVAKLQETERGEPIE